jgi:uncharacterized protein YndB with AHSA1/START domain
MTPTITVDRKTATFTVEVHHDADPDRLWQLWADPRQLERWWGPPTHPATVTDHDLAPGGVVRYFMTSPEGDTYPGGWRVLRVDAPHLLEFEDYFADDTGAEDTDLPLSRSRVTIEGIEPGRSRMTITTRYEDAAAMEKVLEMGMQEGITLALGQIGPLLGAD